MSNNVTKFPNLRNANLEKEFEMFLDDFGGFVYALKAATYSTWEKLAERTGVSSATLVKLAERDYIRGPTLSTFYKVARALDERNIIKHSMYEKWRGFDRKAAKKLDKALSA